MLCKLLFQKLDVITARKRSLRRLCFYRCLSVHGGACVCVWGCMAGGRVWRGVCMVGGMCMAVSCMAGGMRGGGGMRATADTTGYGQ